jgi:hypothetical protein
VKIPQKVWSIIDEAGSTVGALVGQPVVIPDGEVDRILDAMTTWPASKFHDHLEELSPIARRSILKTAALDVKRFDGGTLDITADRRDLLEQLVVHVHNSLEAEQVQRADEAEKDK